MKFKSNDLYSHILRHFTSTVYLKTTNVSIWNIRHRPRFKPISNSDSFRRTLCTPILCIFLAKQRHILKRRTLATNPQNNNVHNKFVSSRNVNTISKLAQFIQNMFASAERSVFLRYYSVTRVCFSYFWPDTKRLKQHECDPGYCYPDFHGITVCFTLQTL